VAVIGGPVGELVAGEGEPERGVDADATAVGRAAVGAVAELLCEDLGAEAQAARAAAVIRRLGAPPPRSRRAPGRLSERELEVASHVAHILTKLGFSARTQVASWVAGQ
jgi:hypothetical protein